MGRLDRTNLLILVSSCIQCIVLNRFECKHPVPLFQLYHCVADRHGKLFLSSQSFSSGLSPIEKPRDLRIWLDPVLIEAVSKPITSILRVGWTWITRVADSCPPLTVTTISSSGCNSLRYVNASFLSILNTTQTPLFQSGQFSSKHCIVLRRNQWFRTYQPPLGG